MAVSSGNRSLLDSTPVASLWVWERTGGAGRRLALPPGAGGQVAFVSPGQVAVAVGRNVLQIDLQMQSAEPKKIASGCEEVMVLAISPDRKSLAYGGRDRTVDLIELATGKLLMRLPGTTSRYSALAQSADRKRIATATIDYRFSNNLPERDLPFANREAKYFALDDNPSRMQPSEVRVWSTDSGQMQLLLPLPSCQVTAIEFVPGGEQLVVAGWVPRQGGLISVWDAATGQRVRDLSNSTAEVLSISFSPRRLELVSGDAKGNLTWWNLATGEKLREQKLAHAIEAVAFSEDGKRLAVAEANRQVQVREASGNSVLQSLKCPAYVESLDFSPDGNWLAAGTRAEGLELWDLLRSGKEPYAEGGRRLR